MLAIELIAALIIFLVLVALVTRDPRRRQIAMEILRMLLRSKNPNGPEPGDNPPAQRLSETDRPEADG